MKIFNNVKNTCTQFDRGHRRGWETCADDTMIPRSRQRDTWRQPSQGRCECQSHAPAECSPSGHQQGLREQQGDWWGTESVKGTQTTKSSSCLLWKWTQAAPSCPNIFPQFLDTDDLPLWVKPIISTRSFIMQNITPSGPRCSQYMQYKDRNHIEVNKNLTQNTPVLFFFWKYLE